MTAYEMRSSDWSSDVCSSDLAVGNAISALSTWLALMMVAMLLCGLGWVLVVSILNATVQMSAQRWVVARAPSLSQMATFSAMGPEERRVGQECVSTCRYRWAPHPKKTKTTNTTHNTCH